MASHTSASAAFSPVKHVIGVAPAYDHAEMTAVAAAHVAYELLALMRLGR